MAENEITLRQIKRAAQDLHEAAAALDECIAHMTPKGSAEIPFLPGLHGLNYIEQWIPQIAKWAEKFEPSVRRGARGYLDGLEPEQPAAPPEKTKSKKGAR